MPGRSFERKDNELQSAKKELQEHIDELSKNQKSMVSMIDDLNDMSASLKSAHDSLEEKVKMRTNELMAVSRKLNRTEKLAFLGKLAGSVTHELRNPIGVLRNAVYFLDKKYKDSDDKIINKYISSPY